MRNRIVAGAAIVMVIVLVGIGVLAPLRSEESMTVEARALHSWGYYVAYADDSFESLRANLNHMDVVAPYSYHLTPNGSLKEFDEPATTAYIRNNSNARILPIVQNEPRWDDFSVAMGTGEKRQAFVDKLLDLVERKGYDGIHIDFEAINTTDSEILTNFMKRLSEAFRPRGLIVSQAIIPRVSNNPTTWGGAYDQKELAKYNDYIVLMAYDHTPVGATKPGPIAPIWWVRQVISYSVTQIPESQIILGVPFYGYDWNTKTGPPATAVTFTRARQLAQRPGATSGFSVEHQTPWIKYQDEKGDQHEIWYENADSFEQRILLAMEYEVAGFAGWRLGHEDPAVWTIVASLETPATPVAPRQSTSTSWYFPETRHTLSDVFLDYWVENGGLSRFGYPRTEPFVEYDPLEGESYLVQYFERARFEFHPEFAGTEYEVLLGHIGRWALQEYRGLDPWETAGSPEPGKQFFPETGHSMSPVFATYWETQGGLSRFGYPISGEFNEFNIEDGNTYLVQYFERARMEWHPEHAGTEFEVLLGLLGNEMLRERGWIR